MAERAETWVLIGRIGKPFGLRGEVVIHYFGDTPARFAPGERVFVVMPSGRTAVRVASSRELGHKFVVAFEGRERVDDVRELVGHEVELQAKDLPALEEGRYYHYELIGLQVFAADGRLLGVLDEILETPGNDVYCVRGGGREILVPALDDAIAEIDLEAGTMRLRDLEGMIEP